MSFGGIFFGNKAFPKCTKCGSEEDSSLVDVILEKREMRGGTPSVFTLPLFHCKCGWVFSGRSKEMTGMLKKHVPEQVNFFGTEVVVEREPTPNEDPIDKIKRQVEEFSLK